MEIRRLVEFEWESYRALRLEALANAPEAFGSDLAEEEVRPAQRWISRLAPNLDSFLLGAWDDEQLVGMVGFYRAEGKKSRHKGTLISMYVTPACRKGGTGKLLVTSLLDQVRQLEGVVQVDLGVGAENWPAIRLYESAGFVQYGLERRSLSVGDCYVDERLMICYLDGYTG